jgi:hypothetical protein
LNESNPAPNPEVLSANRQAKVFSGVFM